MSTINPNYSVVTVSRSFKVRESTDSSFNKVVAFDIELM